MKIFSVLVLNPVAEDTAVGVVENRSARGYMGNQSVAVWFVFACARQTGHACLRRCSSQAEALHRENGHGPLALDSRRVL